VNPVDDTATTNTNESTSNNGSNCFTCRYAIQVRNEKYGLPYRQYIWQGGTYAADLTDVAGNPDPRAGQAWCFGYGEQEWLNPGFQVPIRSGGFRAANWDDYRNRANRELNYRISCE
jgi:hypothetical protein